jgi:UDP-N-acetylglucosamine 4,6-dehydratase
MSKYNSILITGGTGSFGKNFVNYLLKSKNFKKIIIFSRDELKQYELRKFFNDNQRLRFFIGDVRDLNRLKIALEDVDIVIHAAALKQVDTGEYNPIEFINTNIVGSQNIVQASFEKKVKKVIALSTDKASSPINLYGATKLCSDKLFCNANNMFGGSSTKFSVVRYGNVMFSRGSVIPIFSKINNNIYPVTDKKMTRFSITMQEAIKLVMWSLKNTIGGEIVIPNIKSYRILDLVKSYSIKPKIKIIGVRKGEKIHEEMISVDESRDCFKIGDKYILGSSSKKHFNYYKKKFKVVNFERDSFRSNKNLFLTPRQLNEIIKKEIANFIF